MHFNDLRKPFYNLRCIGGKNCFKIQFNQNFFKFKQCIECKQIHYFVRKLFFTVLS